MIARLAGVTYTYPGSDTPALRDIDLDVPEGVFGLVAGASAGGKSTFLRLFNGLVPQFYGGKLAGNTTVCGLDASRTPARRMATLAGLVFQEPEAQSVVDVVEEEIAFGMEQHGVAPAEMERRLVRLFDELGIEHLRYRQLATLSGGERQRVAIAAVLALEPRLLLLDEPTSQLDPAGSAAVLDAVSALNRAGGLTVLAAEHRLQSLLPIVDTVYEVEHGAVRAMAPRDAAATLRSVPAVCELARRAGLDPMPLTVAEALPRLGHLRPLARPSLPAPGDELIAIRGVSAAYGEVPALRDVSLTLRQGEVVALVGPNGSGKSTLFRLLAGLTAPVAGEIAFRGARPPAAVRDRTATAALVPQDPAIALYHESVSEEIGDTLAARRVRGHVRGELERWGLTELASRNPRDLSVGQQQRVAIGAMLAHQPPVWLLDEPTRGADGEARAWLAGRLSEHAASGGAAVVATHDVESAATWATRVVGLRDGRVEFDLPAGGALSAGGPLPTQVSRLVPGALTVEEVAM